MMPIRDPERRLALAYVPAARRAALAALWALDERLAAIVAAAREPMIGRIRLAWWRDALVALDDGPPPAEPLLAALAGEVVPVVAGAEMAEMVGGWDVLLPADEAALETHVQERGERLFALSGRLLGGMPPAGAGAIWARADRARNEDPPLQGRGWDGAFQQAWRLVRGPTPSPSPEGEGRHESPRAAPEYRWPTSLRPLGMLAILAQRDPIERQGSPARVLAMLLHRMTGR